MDRQEAHRIARILGGPAYDGNLIENLLDIVEQWKAPKPDGSYYRPEQPASTSFGVGDTPSTPSCSRYEADNCEHCHAAYGHTILCPLLNRAVAEAQSTLYTPSEADKIAAHALGISCRYTGLLLSRRFSSVMLRHPHKSERRGQHGMEARKLLSEDVPMDENRRDSNVKIFPDGRYQGRES